MIIQRMTAPAPQIPSAPPARLAPFFAFSAEGACPLPMLGVLRASGEDAAKFLQAQLTQDVLEMRPGGPARLAAFCTPKGRMSASFIITRPAENEFLLVCSHELIAGLVKRLSLFVMRAKVKITDASSAIACHGLIGAAAIAAAQTTIQAAAPADAASPEGQAASGLPPLPQLAELPPACGLPRALWLAPAGASAPAASALSENDWLAAEVLAGVARITSATAGAFVPQMLNYESVGGVHFHKGCYPGQEVVARSQFRGVIKRRAFVAHCAAAVQTGQEIFVGGDDQPAGLIALAAAAPGGGSLVIAGLQIAAALGSEPLHAGSPGGPRLEGLHIPYELAHDI